jgi:hypothetical protein
MLELMNKVRELLFLKPYTFEDYVRDADPQTPYELEQLERNWLKCKREFTACY